MRISIIVAMDRNGLIGAGGGLPWHLPDDMRWFRRMTMGKPVIMGRRTYETIPDQFRPLRGRHNIVLTRNPAYQSEGCTVVRSLSQALSAAAPADEFMIGGGAQLYALFLPSTDRIYLTRVEAELEGDTFFPALNLSEWQQLSSEYHPADEKHAQAFHWQVLERRDRPAAAADIFRTPD